MSERIWKKRIQRPIPVYLATFWVFFRYGILALIGTFGQIRAVDGDILLHVAVLTFLLQLFTAGAAVWAFIGHNEGRIALMVVLPLNLLWPALLALSNLTDDDPGNDKETVSFLIGLGISSIWIILVEAYFLSATAVAYYKQNDGN